MFIYLSKKVSAAASAVAQPRIDRGWSSRDLTGFVDRSLFPTTSTSSVSPGTKIKASLPAGATTVFSGCSNWKRSPVTSHRSVVCSFKVSATEVLLAEVHAQVFLHVLVSGDPPEKKGKLQTDGAVMICLRSCCGSQSSTAAAHAAVQGSARRSQLQPEPPWQLRPINTACIFFPFGTQFFVSMMM